MSTGLFTGGRFATASAVEGRHRSELVAVLHHGGDHGGPPDKILDVVTLLVDRRVEFFEPLQRLRRDGGGGGWNCAGGGDGLGRGARARAR